MVMLFVNKKIKKVDIVVNNKTGSATWQCQNNTGTETIFEMSNLFQTTENWVGQ